MTIKNKLLVAFGFTLLLMIIMGAVSYNHLTSIEKANRLALEKMELVNLFEGKKSDHLNWLGGLCNSLLYGKKFEGQLDFRICSLGSWYYDYLESADFENSSEEVKEKLLALEEPHRLMHQSAGKVNELPRYGSELSDSRALDVYSNEVIPHLDKLGSIMLELEELYLQEQEVLMAEIEAHGNAVRRALIVTIIISVLLVIIVSSLLSGSIVKPIQAMVERAQEIATGNLTRKIDVNSKDEVGMLARAFNQMIDGIRDLLWHVNGSAESVEQLSGNLSDMTEALSASIQEVAGSTNHVAASAQELSANSQEMAYDSRDVVERAHQGEKGMQSTLQKMQEIEKNISHLQEAVERLGNRSAEIETIINIINGIAEQTNLLALNAAIEAARAGEQGRGFSVVAEEIRKLAEQSAEATSEIRNLILATQRDADEAVQNMERSFANVAEGSKAMITSEESFQHIVKAVQQLMNSIEEIAAAAEEFSASSEQVAAATEEQSAATEEISGSSDELEQASSNLFEQIKKFKLE
ncbi:MAG TPA: HAMP domain-containing protein [Firmicutes bacterium]|nr:HAMP domain-containing protein [Bacillota bacterium]